MRDLFMIRSAMRTATVAEWPDLVEPGWERTRDTLPEYNDHGDVLNVRWGCLTDERPEFQFHLVDEEDQVLTPCAIDLAALGRHDRGSPCRHRR